MREQGRHYERAFEAYLRARRVPYVAVDEARRSLVPPAGWTGNDPLENGLGDLKSFDYLVYPAAGPNLLVDIKGRRAGRGGAPSGLQSWVTEDDVRSLLAWERLFGGDGAHAEERGRAFRAAFVFMYWCDDQPADASVGEVMRHHGRWYAMRTVSVADYAAAMRPRSPRWRTVGLPAREFDRLSAPSAAPALLRA